MSQSSSLCFNDVTISPVIRENYPWFRSSDLAHALGYASEKSVANIYNRNSDEFSNDMSVVINLSTTEMPLMTRIFSLRGCHLIAMFARTPVAKAFRRWVLDVIEQYGDRVPVQPSTVDDAKSITITPSTTESRKPLTALINVWARQSGQRHAECRCQLNAAFKLNGIKELPEEWLPDALAWVQKKIDANQTTSELPYTERMALPIAPKPQALPMLPAEVMTLYRAAVRPAFTECTNQAYRWSKALKEAEANPNNMARVRKLAKMVETFNLSLTLGMQVLDDLCEGEAM